MTTILPLDTDHYVQLHNDINTFLLAGKNPVITLYNDPSGIDMVTDVTGNVIHHSITTVSYSSEYTDISGNITYPTLTISFMDGTVFTAVDDLQQYWYELEGVDIPPMAFGEGSY